jgi:flagellar protein FlgJ
MSGSINLERSFALDMGGLERLKQTNREDPGEGLKQAANQFEALFLNKLMVAMREASPRSGLLDSQQTRFYESLFDQQMSQHLAGRGLGLAEQLIQQLSSGSPAAPMDPVPAEQQ